MLYTIIDFDNESFEKFTLAINNLKEGEKMTVFIDSGGGSTLKKYMIDDEKFGWITVDLKKYFLNHKNMGNPYPTRSKPVPIGKKHTNQPRTKARQRQENARARRNQEKLRKIRVWKNKVHSYWLGLIDEYPNFPKSF